MSVLFTTVFSWLRINSLTILLCVACAIWHSGFRRFLRQVFSNALFVAFLAYALIEAAGLLHTGHWHAQLNMISKDGTLVAMGCLLCTGRFAGPAEYRKLMWAYCGIVVLASAYCLLAACVHFAQDRQTNVFFYHALTSAISQNAVVYSVYVFFAMIFLLLSRSAAAAISRREQAVRLGLVIFFLGMLFLLSSKLLLALGVLLVAAHALPRFDTRRRKGYAAALAAGLVLLLAGVVLTDNPVRARYSEVMRNNTEVLRMPAFNPGMYFNAIQLRLIEWRFGGEILREHPGAWLYGVSPGDSQFLLDQKYVGANMYIGNPADGPDRHERGFIGYNFHDQFLETEVRDGAIGLIALLAILALMVRAARRQRSRMLGWMVLALILFFIPEAPLTLQQGLFLFCFFPMAAPYGEKNTKLCR